MWQLLELRAWAAFPLIDIFMFQRKALELQAPGGNFLGGTLCSWLEAGQTQKVDQEQQPKPPFTKRGFQFFNAFLIGKFQKERI